MFKCKIWENPFEMLRYIPYILRCGHTFCKPCIKKQFEYTSRFNCEGCFYVCHDPDELVINHILCDKTAIVQQKRGFDFIGSFPKITPNERNNMMKVENEEAYPQISISTFDARQSGYQKQCEMRFCDDIAVDGRHCEKCIKALHRDSGKMSLTPNRMTMANSVKREFMTPTRESNLKSSFRSFNNASVKSRNITPNKNHPTVKRLTNMTIDSKQCRNPECDKPAYKHRSNEMEYCGFQCQRFCENN